MSERVIPEKPEVDIKENGDDNKESNEGSGNHEADSIKKISFSDCPPRAVYLDSSNIDNPTRGGKISNTAREEVDRGFEDTSLKDGSNKLLETHNILEALLDKEMLGDDLGTLDSELYEQESRQINCLIGSTEVQGVILFGTSCGRP